MNTDKSQSKKLYRLVYRGQATAEMIAEVFADDLADAVQRVKAGRAERVLAQPWATHADMWEESDESDEDWDNAWPPR